MIVANSGHKLFDVLANKLQALSVAQIGTNLFINFLPEDVSEGAVFLDVYIQRTTFAEIPGYRRCTFRVVVRSHSYSSGFALSNAISSALTTLAGTIVDGVEIKVLDAKHDPIALPPSPSTEAVEFVVNYDIAYGLLG